MKMFLVAVLGALLAAAANASSPAILWPADEFRLRDGQSALEVMSSEEFSKLFQNKKVVVFSKRSLAIEDVAYPARPLAYLQSVEAVALQGVKAAHRLLASLTASDDMKLVPLDDQLSMADLDKQIESTMKQHPGYAAILIGSGGAQRRRRAADNKPACEARSPGQKGCMGYVAAVKKNDAADSCTVTCGTDGSMSIVAAGVTLKVTSANGGYQLAAEGDYSIDAETTWAPESFSYSCADLRLVSKDRNTIVTLSGLQLWPKEGEAFPDSFDCATWFTTTLWAGFVVVLFYLFILFGAILFLLDVKTNDRFDDPKGKTITVNVSE